MVPCLLRTEGFDRGAIEGSFESEESEVSIHAARRPSGLLLLLLPEIILANSDEGVEVGQGMMQ